MTRILGIDPGSRLTGFGCVDAIGNRLVHVSHGTLRLSRSIKHQLQDPLQDQLAEINLPFEKRLLLLYQGLSEVILKYRPQNQSFSCPLF